MCVAFTVSATPIVTDWDFVVDSSFTAWAAGGITGSAANSHFGGATKLEWGSGDDGPSYLEIDSGTAGHYEGFDLAMEDIALITTLRHYNFPIFGPFLQTATLSTRLELDGGAGFDALAELDFGITFKETTNRDSIDDCGFNTKTDTPCDDIFIVVPPAGVSGVFDIELGAFVFDQFFIYDSNHYIAQLIVEGLGPLVPDAPLMSACSFAGVPEGCIGFLTEEGQNNNFKVSLRILVPEPSVILLMSLALIGIFTSMRNKHI